MADDPENLTLRLLRSMDIKVDRVLREVQALKAHSIATGDSLVDIQNLDERVARTETRLDLRDAEAPRTP